MQNVTSEFLLQYDLHVTSHTYYIVFKKMLEIDQNTWNC